MTAHLSSFPSVLGVVAAGALLTVHSVSWVRSRALARIEHVPNSPRRPDWAYTAALWTLALLLGLAYYAVGLMPLRLSIPLTVASTLGMLGLIWPPYVQDARLTPAQRLVRRVVALVVSGILISIAAGHFGEF